MSPDVLKRIVRAKYVYERARSMQREKHEMTHSLSLLLMHDAVELLMIAVLDHLGAPSKERREFMDFWPDVEKQTGKIPTDKMKMQALNKSRVSLKHHGTMPDTGEVADFVSRVEGFFENVLRDFCATDYYKVSYLDLLDDAVLLRLINEARTAFAGGAKGEAIIYLAFAVDRIEHRDGYQLPLLVAPEKPLMLRSDSREAAMMVDQIYDYFRRSAASINSLTLQKNPRQWESFNKYRPGVIWSMTGVPHITLFPHVSYNGLPEEEFESFISLIVEYGLHASELYSQNARAVYHRKYILR